MNILSVKKIRGRMLIWFKVGTVSQSESIYKQRNAKSVQIYSWVGHFFLVYQEKTSTQNSNYKKTSGLLI